MKLAVVGSRQGADLEHVRQFVSALPSDTVIVSGGAVGVDRTAESTWLEKGGRVLSFRPKQYGEDFGIEVWDLGGDNPRVHELTNWRGAPADYKSACILRDILIAETADRLVAFYKKGRSWGAGFIQGWAHDMGRPDFAFSPRDGIAQEASRGK